MTKKEYEEFLNEFQAQEKDLKSNGGRIPDSFINRYGSWLRKNDPIAFEVGYYEYKRNLKKTR